MTHRPFPPSILPRALSMALLLPAFQGCESPNRPEVVTTVADSAGVVVVENRGEVGPDGGGWRVSPEPGSSIGSFQGDSLQQLFQVQGATMLQGGRVAVANAGSGEIRVYGPDGVFLAAHGRKGEGPGEFQRPALAGKLGGDTLVVVDVQLQRISLMDTREGFLSSTRISEALGGGLFPRGMFQDRSVVLGGGFYWSGDSGEQLSDGYSRRKTSYRSASLDGEPVTDFGLFPGSEFFMRVRRVGEGMVMAARLIPFGKFPMQAVGPRHLFLASGDRWEVRGFSPDGTLERIIRWDRPPLPVTTADVVLLTEEEVAEAGDPARAREIRDELEEMPVPEFMPAFAGLVADAHGYLWVERSRPPADTTPRFDILDPEGRVVGWVSLPEALELLEIGPDYLLGLHRDELGVEYLRMYELTRPEGG